MSRDEVLWKREEHTAAKHELLKAFFNKWVSVHSEFFSTQDNGGLVRIYDGCAGPGIYADGEPGSPLIIMRALCENPNLLSRWAEVRYDLRFVEKDPRRATKLQELLEAFEAEMREGPRWTERVSWTVKCGRYEENLPQETTERSALFLFLDPFGYSHAPMTLTQDLVQQPKSDTLIFLPLSFVNRFTTRDNQEVAMDRFFGTSAWRRVTDGKDRPERLLALFEQELRSAGLDYTGAFKLQPDRTNAYYIVGGSGHWQGWESIKGGFWTVDPLHGREYQAPLPAPVGQLSLGFGEPERPLPETTGLLDVLRETYSDEWFTVEDAMEVTKRSRYLQTHIRRATLKLAEERGELTVERPNGGHGFSEGRGIRMRFSGRPAQ